MRSPITLNFRIYQQIGKNMFPNGKTGTLNPSGILHRPQNFMVLGEVVNIYIDYAMFYPCRHMKWKHCK